VDRFPSVKNDLSHKQKGELANLTRSIHACPENDLHLMLIQQCDEKDDRPLANRLGPSLEGTGRAGKTQLNSAWRNGAKNTNQNGQQQKTTQEQRQLAHWNLYSCDAGMGTLSSLG
jgi:hypothetical protein